MFGLVKMMCSASKGQNWARRSQLIPAEIARSLLPLACCPELSARTIRWNHQLELSVLVNVNSGDTHSHRSGVWEQLCEHDDWSREPMAENICNEVEELLWCTGEGCCQGGGGGARAGIHRMCRENKVLGFWTLPSSCGNLPVPLTS